MKCKAGFELNLSNLKTLYVNTLCDDVRLNCPNLSHLLFRVAQPSFDRPAHYKQIRKLTCFYYQKWIAELENLETLVCQEFTDQNGPLSLEFFPQLKFLYIFSCTLLRNCDQRLEEEKARLKRDDLKIYFWGKLGTEYRSGRWRSLLNWSIYECGNIFAYYYRNELAKLSPTLSTYSCLHYDPGFRDYDRRFYKRLQNVQALGIVQGPITQCKIVDMVNCFRNLVILWITEGEHLDKSFYSRLPDHYPHLRMVRIDNSKFEIFDLHFLFKLNELYRVAFKKLKLIKSHPDYKKLARKVRKKRLEIAKINGDLLFEIDKFQFELDIMNYYRRPRITSLPN